MDLKKVTLAGSLLSVGCAVAAQGVEFRTTTFSERWRDASASVEAAKASYADLSLDLAATDQTVLGFGVCASELSWNSLSALGEADRKSILDEMFSKDGGAFSVIRTPIGASDFATDFYSYSETPGDFAMEKFSIERDRKALLPLLKEILARNDGTFKVWASPWCPPLWMKKSGAYASKPQTDPTWPKNDCSPEQRVREGEDGFLCDDAHFAAYAKYFRKYVDAYRAEGVPVWMVMPQNEFNSDQVFPSCTWQAKSLAAFVGKYLGPALEGSGTELYFGTMERPSLQMARTILDDPDCRRYVKGAGFQWAGKGAIGKVREMYPELTLVQTEQECGDGRNDWRHARHSWELMRHYFRCGVSYYCYWNLSLVDNAMSRWGWRQNSLVSVVPAKRSFAYNVEYHVLKQLSHYVKHGARRLKTAEGDWLAFVNPDGSVVVAFGNAGPARNATVAIGGAAWKVPLPADSVSTLVLPSDGRHTVEDSCGPGDLPEWAFGPFVRPNDVNPVISPNKESVFDCPMRKRPIKWEESDTFNPAAAVKDGKIVVLYRAEDNTAQGIGSRTSRLGYAETTDGSTMKREAAPVLFPCEDDQKEFDWEGGCEDPRVAMTEDGLYVLTYTSWNRKLPRLCVATSRDLRHWKKHGPAFARLEGEKGLARGSKSAAILQRQDPNDPTRWVIAKVGGKYIMYWGEGSVNVATSENLVDWIHEGMVMAPRAGFFDSALTEVGPAALLTKKGIVVFYNGKNATDGRADQKYPKGVYCGGQALFDAANPKKFLDRLDVPYFKPEADFEKTGQYKDGTVFTEGLVFHSGKWHLYYGCADSFVGYAVWNPDSGK